MPETMFERLKRLAAEKNAAAADEKKNEPATHADPANAPAPPPNIQRINPPESTAAHQRLAETSESPLAASVPADAGPTVASEKGAKARAKVKTNGPEMSAPSKAIGMLLIDCAPWGMVAPTFEDLLSEARKMIASTKFTDSKGAPYDVPDYRFVEFGRGPSVLLAAFAKLLEKTREVLVVSNSSGPEESIVLSLLVANAQVVIRSTK